MIEYAVFYDITNESVRIITPTAIITLNHKPGEYEIFNTERWQYEGVLQNYRKCSVWKEIE